MFPTSFEQVQDLPLFRARPFAEIERLLTGARPTKVQHRECLYAMGDAAETFAVVLDGAFKLVKPTLEGSDMIVFFATPGDVIAGLVMATPSTYPVSAVAMGPSTVLKVPRQTFVEFWSANSSIQQSMRAMLFSRMNLMHEQKALLKAPLAQKIAREIVSLIDRYSGQGEAVLPIPLTRQEIGDSVGASVESVIRVMSEWSRSGYIKTTDQVIHVSRMDKIVEIMMGQSEK